MSTNNSTPPNAIDLALDALREYEQQDEIARNADREYRREIAGHQAEVQRNRAAILAQVAMAQAIVALTHTLAGATDDKPTPPAFTFTLYDQMQQEIESLRQQLIEADADNTALIAKLHPGA